MPLREYICEGCRHIWEVLNPKGEQACPKCGGVRIRQKVSACNWNWGGIFLHWEEEAKEEKCQR